MRKLIIPSIVLALLASTATAAVTPNSFISPQTPNRGVVQFLQGTDSAGTYKTVYTAGTNGSRCYSLWSTNNDATSTHLLTVQVVNTAIKYGGMSVTSATSAGFVAATTAQNLMSASVWPGLPVDQYGNPYLQMISGDTLQATFATALSTSAVINLYASCSDF